MAAGAEQEEVYTLLLTNIKVDSMLKVSVPIATSTVISYILLPHVHVQAVKVINCVRLSGQKM